MVDVYDPRASAAAEDAASAGFDLKSGKYKNPPYYDQAASDRKQVSAVQPSQQPKTSDGGAIKWPQDQGHRNGWVDHG